MEKKMLSKYWYLWITGVRLAIVAFAAQIIPPWPIAVSAYALSF
nr:hypothetical protein [Hydrogenoanaerobacterium saccharovorans]